MHELIFYGWYGRHKYYGGKDKSVLNCPKPKSNTIHPTMKPPALLRKLIHHGTEPGMVVYDAFGGSGSTLIACEQWGRKCRIVEISEEYCQSIVIRYIKLREKMNRSVEVKINGKPIDYVRRETQKAEEKS
jgi:DNA modification methylase